MFSKLVERFKSESGTIATVYILAAAILFVAGFGAAFSLGKYVQGSTFLQRCTSMVAKGTMVYMQRQAPPDKGVLTAAAEDEGRYIFNTSICNSGEDWNPLMASTGSIDFRMYDSQTLLVTITQYTKGYMLNDAFPIQLSSQAAAYTYQYGAGRQNTNPIYGAASGAGLLGSGVDNTSPVTPTTGSGGGSTPDSSTGGSGTTDTQAGGTDAGTSPDPTPSPTPTPTPTPTPSPTVEPTYENPYPEGTEGLICHATNNANKYPYQQIGPATAGVINGHMDHMGAIFNPTMKGGDHWGDIIPPLPEAGIAGLNWDATGQAIWHNACDYWTTTLP